MLLEPRRRALLHAMHSRLRSQTRRQSGEIVALLLLRRRAAVAAVRAVAVIAMGVVASSTTTIVRWAVVSRGEVHSLPVRAAAVLRESDAAVGAAGLVGAVARSLHVVVV
jgi:hypothetical protein